ncbi:MAG: methyltransferase regulatory domain-containing protein [Blastocatellia bacterium]|nr:methyltransferase regulatory domain-containing protein [Blastocatellia bacterium]
MSSEFAYDAVAYPSFVFPHIRPDRLGAIAMLHGVDVPPIDNCRVLELGCGDGANLISIAYSMPGSQCIGLDLSIERIKEAKQIAEVVGISNADFHQADVMEFDAERFGRFDFIIAHGLFSWVPDFVREKILWIYSNCLEPNGVGYISYNAYPGWHLRGFIRDAMRFQSELISDPAEKVESAMNFLRFLKEGAPDDSFLKSFLDAEIELSEDRPPQNLFHDELSDNNQPFYFTKFVEFAEKYGLQYIAESEPASAFERRFPDFVRQALERLGDDYLRREQYADFLKARRFRSSLICHKDVNINHRADRNRIDRLLVASMSRPLTPNAKLDDDSTVTFAGPAESEFTINHPFVKTALSFLSERWPERFTYQALENIVSEHFPNYGEEEKQAGLQLLKGYLVELFHSTAVEFRCFAPIFLLHISERPKVSNFARWQAGSGYDYVNGMTGASMGIRDEMARALLLAADGTRTRDELVSECSRVGSAMGGSTGSSPEDFVDNNLKVFLNTGLLVA